MEKHDLLKGFLVAALLTPTQLIPFVAAGQLMAQDNLVVNGVQLLDFNATQGMVQVCGLPTGHDYTGAAPQFSENAQYDENGKLLFFINDGNIYDQAGYLMADNDADPNCHSCLMKGIQEVGITLVPGTCDKYYIIMADSQNNGSSQERSQLTYSILDLSLQSYFHPDRRGRVWTLSDAENTPGYETLYPDGGINNRQINGGSLFLIVNGNMSGGSSTNRTVNLQQVIYNDASPSAPKILFVKTFREYLAAPIGQYGIGQATTIYNNMIPASDAEFRFSGQLVTSTGPNSDVLLAGINPEDNDQPQSMDYKTLEVLTMASIGATPTIQRVNTNLTHLSAEDSKPRGLVFSPNGRYLYFAQHVAPLVGYIDMLDPTLAVHDLGTDLGVNFSGFGNGQINVNKAPAGTGDALYFPSANGIGYLEDPDQPTAATWHTDLSVPVGSSIAIPPTSYWSQAGSGYSQYLMDKQNYNDQQIPDIEQQTCCLVNERIPEASHPNEFSGTTTSSQPWTPANNGLTDPELCSPANSGTITGHVYFDQDFVVHSGAQLYVQDMDWRFAPNARLIVERGGLVKFTNCTLEGSQCAPDRWPGIRVEGTTTASQYPTAGGAQGYLILANSTVKDAEVGVWCAREENGNLVPGYYGGIVRTSGGAFLNCIRDVRIENYPDQPFQFCYFSGTQFLTDNNWPAGANPLTHAMVLNTGTVNFINCTFANDNGTIPHTSAGGGIVVYNARVNVQGSAPHANTFRNLQVGVLNAGGIISASTVDHSNFENTFVGISDWGSRFARYTNNTFDLPNAENGNTFTGIYLWQAQGYTVERNQFTGAGNDHNVGIYFKGYAPNGAYSQWNYVNNQIYNNTFTALFAGCIVQYINRGYGPSEEQQGLSLFCGDYTDNIYDIALLKSSIIRSNQGFTGQQLSGNRFLTTANCTTDWDWNLDPEWNVVLGYPSGMTTSVYRNNDPVCDVHCEDWPDFADIDVLQSGLWTRNGTCGSGKLDNTHTIPLDRSAYNLAKSQLDDALNVYNGNLDAGDKPDLIEMLTKEEPPLPSSTLRDALLANSPLSDEVLITMLKRDPAMDPWHLTQVLVANVKLNTGVINTAKELLSPFYFGIVNDAQEGSGVTWKQLMEEEIDQRRSEKADALASLGYLYATDTTYEGGLDSLRALLAADADPDYSQLRTELDFSEGNWAAADTELTGPGSKLNGWQNYHDLMKFGGDHEGNWAELEPAEADSLDAHMKGGEAGAALCGGILRSIDRTDYMPPVEFPRDERSATATNEQREDHGSARPALALYPNPASTEAYLTWPVKEKGAAIVVLDGQGRILMEQKAVENGVSRLDLRSLPPGIYKVFLRECGLSTSLSVVR